MSACWYNFEPCNTQQKENKKELFEEQLQQIIDSNQEALENVNLDNSNWKFSGYRTILTAGATGNFGLLNWGSQKTIQLEWRPTNKEIIETQETALDLSKFNNKQEAVLAFQQNAIKILKTDQQNIDWSNINKVIHDFYDFMVVLAETPKNKWEVEKLRLDVNFSLEGSAAGPFVKIGGDSRIRLEWSRQKEIVFSSKNEKSPIQKQLTKIIDLVTAELQQSEINQYHLNGHELEHIRIGLNVGVNGDVGILKGSAGVIPYIYLKQNQNANSKELILSKNQKENEELEIIEFEQSEKSIFRKKNKINANKLRKGFNKAIEFSQKVSRNLATKKPQKKWKLSAFNINYTFSTGGELGVVSLKAAPVFEFHFKPKA